MVARCCSNISHLEVRLGHRSCAHFLLECSQHLSCDLVPIKVLHRGSFFALIRPSTAQTFLAIIFCTCVIVIQFRRRTMSGDSPLTVVTPEKFRADVVRRGDPDLIARVDAFFAARKNRSTRKTNRKRTGDGSIAQPAKRQSNVVASSSNQSTATAPSKAQSELSQPQAAQPPVCLQSQKACGGKELVANRFLPL